MVTTSRRPGAGFGTGGGLSGSSRRISSRGLTTGCGGSRRCWAGGVVSGNPHLLPRIEKMLVESLAGYVLLPGDGPYVTAPGLGDRAGPLGSIALAARALA